MPIPSITRNVVTRNVSAAYTVSPDDDQIVGNCTAAGFTVTLYKDTNSGTYHRLVVKIDDADVSGNTLTITDGTFSTSLSATSGSVELETNYLGAWFVVAQFPTAAAATASSKADSAGLAASAAQSASVSAGAGGTGASVATSTATSQNTVQSGLISQGGSTATSQNASQSLNVSTAQSSAIS